MSDPFIGESPIAGFIVSKKIKFSTAKARLEDIYLLLLKLKNCPKNKLVFNHLDNKRLNDTGYMKK